MNFRVSVVREAEKIPDRLDRPTEQSIRARFVQLALDPFDPRLSASLAGKPWVRKSRVGGWRVFFTVDREGKAIYVLTVDTRGQVYKH